MYLVELRPGKEELYRTVDELAAAIRSGDVDAHSRIFHRATSKWISITLHPQFKAISAAREQEADEPRKQWTFLNSASDELGPGQAAEAQASAPEVVEEPADQEPGPDATPSTDSWRRPFALGMAGLMAILGAQLGSSIARGRWAGLEGFLPAAVARSVVHQAARRPASVMPAVTSGSSTVSLAAMAGAELRPVAHSASAADSVAARAPAPASAKRRPIVRVAAVAKTLPAASAESDAGALMVDSLIQQYEAAYDDARSRLTADLRAAEFREPFAPEQLASAERVERARLSVAGARRAVDAYRERANQIERTYQDTFAVRSRTLDLGPRQVLRWYARPRRSEPAAVAALSGAVLTTADSVFTVLATNVGTYTVAHGSIEFTSADAAAEYGRLRQRLERQLDSAREAQGSLAAVAVLLETGRIGVPPVQVSSR